MRNRENQNDDEQSTTLKRPNCGRISAIPRTGRASDGKGRRYDGRVGRLSWRRFERAAALGERAAALGIDSFEYLLRFAVETDAERQQILQARNDAIARAIGLK